MTARATSQRSVVKSSAIFQRTCLQINKQNPTNTHHNHPTHKIFNHVRAQGRPYHRYHRPGWFLPHRAPSREGLHCESFICPCAARPPIGGFTSKCLRRESRSPMKWNVIAQPNTSPFGPYVYWNILTIIGGGVALI